MIYFQCILNRRRFHQTQAAGKLEIDAHTLGLLAGISCCRPRHQTKGTYLLHQATLVESEAASVC